MIDTEGEQLYLTPNPSYLQVAIPESNEAHVNAVSLSNLDSKEHIPSTDMNSNQNVTNEIYTSSYGHHVSAAETQMAGAPELGVDSIQSSNSSDADSAMGNSFTSSTVSIRESVYEYVEKNGRTYHHAYNSGKYILPNDDVEQEGLGIESSIKDTALEEWVRVTCLAAEHRGCKVTNSKYYGKWMAEAGFVDIVEKHFFWPCNPWVGGEKEKLLAMWTQQNLLDGIEGMTMRNLTAGLGWTPEQVEILLVGVRKDLKNKMINYHVDVVVFYGRKPGLVELANEEDSD
ncbi:hypothetical protein BOTCAL_0046g00210 [Botryotinia calthae]|uniref:Methyltransferase domain-containing protein n=1 Tax=Botryotinia calthae TaxID=38488 RepID=A0A4Y8DDV7_9HELO|nr:hypothetical protein BOTCAL_0046g00210 [Botryotinia calthae]